MRKYAEDYDIVVDVDDKGREKRKAVYHGDYFEIDLDQASLTKFNTTSILLMVAIIIFHIAGGFVGNRGMYHFFVVLPYTIAFFPMLYMVVGVISLPREKRKYRRDEIGLSFTRIKNTSTILLILLSIGVIGEILYLLFFAGGSVELLEIIFLALEALATAAVYLSLQLQKNIIVKKCEEELLG